MIENTTEKKMDDALKEILEYFKLEYISDIHIQFNREKILEYLHDKQLETTDYELYIKLLEYITVNNHTSKKER